MSGDMTEGVEWPFLFDSSATQVMLFHIEGNLPNPQDKNPELSDGIVKVLAKMMAKEPKHRYVTAAALMEDLERVERDEGPAHAGEDMNVSIILPPKPRHSRKSKEKSGCLSVLMGLAGFACLIWWV